VIGDSPSATFFLFGSGEAAACRLCKRMKIPQRIPPATIA
jgi:hypothetical protein